MLSDSTIAGLVARLRTATVATCDRLALDGLARDSRTLRSWLDAIDAHIAARAAERRAGICRRLPEFHDALGDGEVSAGHVDAIGRATLRLTGTEQAAFDAGGEALLDAAKTMGVEEFSRHCHRRARRVAADDGVSRQQRLHRERGVARWIDAESGMAITRIALDPVTDEAMWTPIIAAVRARRGADGGSAEPWEHTAVDTIVELITGNAAAPVDHGDAPAAEPGEDPLGGRVEVCVHVDWAALRADAVAHGVLCETVGGVPLPIATVRRLCCEAKIIPLVIGSDGAVLDQGRATRLATREQRQALAAMYSTCAFPGCHVRFAHCQVHHVTDWTSHRGPTDLDNLLPQCARHHHLLHEGRWTLVLRPDRTITVTRPDGVVFYEGQSTNRRRGPPQAA